LLVAEAVAEGSQPQPQPRDWVVLRGNVVVVVVVVPPVAVRAVEEALLVQGRDSHAPLRLLQCV
jgi:hypothetical protein